MSQLQPYNDVIDVEYDNAPAQPVARQMPTPPMQVGENETVEVKYTVSRRTSNTPAHYQQPTERDYYEADEWQAATSGTNWGEVVAISVVLFLFVFALVAAEKLATIVTELVAAGPLAVALAIILFGGAIYVLRLVYGMVRRK